MALLTKAEIFAASPLTRDIEVPEWGGTVRVKAMDVRTRLHLLDLITMNESEIAEHDALSTQEKARKAQPKRFDQVILQILVSLVDEADEPMFTIDDYAKFETLNYATIEKVFEAIVALRTPVVFEDQKKSSAPITKGGSSSGLRRTSGRR